MSETLLARHAQPGMTVASVVGSSSMAQTASGRARPSRCLRRAAVRSPAFARGLCAARRAAAALGPMQMRGELAPASAAGRRRPTPSASATALAMQTGVDMQLPSPTPLAPSGVNGDGVSRCRMIGSGTSIAVGTQIVGERAGQESCRPRRRRIPRRAPRRAPARSRRVICPVDHAGMQDAAAIVHGDVLVDAHLAGRRDRSRRRRNRR